MRKLKRYLLILIVLLVAVGGAFYFSRNFRHEQLRAYAIGSIEVAGRHYTAELPEAHRVEICLIGNEAAAKSVDTFPVRVDGASYYSILKRKTLNGADAEELVKIWRAIYTDRRLSAMCHEPAYGLRFFKSDQLVFETSICFHCSNFYVPTPLGYTFCGFDAKDNTGLALLGVLNRHIPLPESSKPKWMKTPTTLSK